MSQNISSHSHRRARRSGERGNSLVLATIALTGLVTLGSLTVLSVQGGMASTGQERFNSMALYAAESGAAVAMDYLRQNVDPAAKWSAFVSPSNASPPFPAGIYGNQKQPGDPSNLFSPGVSAWYEVSILNNRTDPNFANPSTNDSDARVIIRSTGHGPDGSTAQVEWEVAAGNITGSSLPCNETAQKDQNANGNGNNGCLGTVDSSVVVTATITP